MHPRFEKGHPRSRKEHPSPKIPQKRVIAYRPPAEILRTIFSLIEDNSLSYSCQSPKSWTNFSRVSQHWRSLALSAPELWTNIPVSHSRWAQEMLIRSKMAKLAIRSCLFSDNRRPRTRRTFRSCLYKMDRIEEMAISVQGLKWIDIYPSLRLSFIHCASIRIPEPHFDPQRFLLRRRTPATCYSVKDVNKTEILLSVLLRQDLRHRNILA